MDLSAFKRCTNASSALANAYAQDPQGWADFLALDDADMLAWLEQMAVHARVQADDLASFNLGLQRTRVRLAFQIACAEILQLVPIRRSLRALSDLADALIEQAYAHHFAALCSVHGTPRNAALEPQALCVMALGKLGGGELNFSSDVDLIFVFGDHGQTDGARVIDNEAFFLRLGQRLIATLSDPAALVYRVDMRLRPFGESGRLSLSLNATEHYYQVEGRDWERYAWIKARACAGDKSLGARLLGLLKPFVYRRYLDFTALKGLRDMKVEIERKVARDGGDDDLKLGRGGIREIEFLIQLEQLIRGGRESSLRTPSLYQALAAQIELRPERGPELSELLDHYELLRRVENRVQMAHDQQCHALPSDPEMHLRISQSLGFSDSVALEQALLRTRNGVRAAFESVLKVSEPNRLQLPVIDGWLAAMVERLRTLARAERVSLRVEGYLDQLLPQLAHRAQLTDLPEATAERVFRLLGALLKRGTYLALIAEQPLVQERVLTLAARSNWLVSALIDQPILLDELIDPRLFELESATIVRTRLDARLSSANALDLEADMDALRQIRAAQLFRIGLSYLDARIDATTALERFSELAELLLSRSLKLAIDSVASSLKLDPATLGAGIAVIGYGSLGAGELSPQSDLDLLFLLDDQAEPSSAYRRIAQRLLHILTTQTGAGRLFEVDTRLKPNGSAGQLVSTLGAFARYQLLDAWTWEHQALVHARAVAGSAQVALKFEQLRAQVLSQAREPAALSEQIQSMFQRLSETDDPKHRPLGPTALKFEAERLVLLHAHARPELLCARSAAAILSIAIDARLDTQGFSKSDAVRVDRWRLDRALGLIDQRKPPNAPID